ncbi:hypothetical protein [Streptomyces mirabilis]|uniref:hypothetical protein n=1 Tax=Streptomyces mirabilis TaxID=68239 RepID=UPI0036EF19D1
MRRPQQRPHPVNAEPTAIASGRLGDLNRMQGEAGKVFLAGHSRPPRRPVDLVLLQIATVPARRIVMTKANG